MSSPTCLNMPTKQTVLEQTAANCLLIPVQRHQWSWGAWKIWPSTTSSAFSTHCSVDLHQGASKIARITLTLFPQGWKLTDHVTAPSYPADWYPCLAWTSGPHMMGVQTVWTQEHQSGLPMMGTSHKTGRQNKPRPFLPKIYQKWGEYGAAFTTTLLRGLRWFWKLLNEYMELFMLLEIPAAKNVQEASTLCRNVKNTLRIVSKSALYATIIFFCFFTFTSWVKDAFPQDRASSR